MGCLQWLCFAVALFGVIFWFGFDSEVGACGYVLLLVAGLVAGCLFDRFGVLSLLFGLS